MDSYGIHWRIRCAFYRVFGAKRNSNASYCNTFVNSQKRTENKMRGWEHGLSYVWIAVGVILAFYAWSYVAPAISGTTA